MPRVPTLKTRMDEIEDELLAGKRSHPGKGLIVTGGGFSITDHNRLMGLQGGLATDPADLQFYHLTSAQHAGLVGGVATRVAYYASTGVLTTDADLTFDGTILSSGGYKDASLTSGRIIFVGASGRLLDDPGFTFDAVDNILTLSTDEHAGIRGIADSSATTGEKSPFFAYHRTSQASVTAGFGTGIAFLLGTSGGDKYAGCIHVSTEGTALYDAQYDFEHFTNGTEGSQTTIFTLRSSGQLRAKNGSIGAPAYSWIDSPTLGMYRKGTSEIGFNGNIYFDDAITANSLTGTGTRIVKASTTGVLSAAALTAGEIPLHDIITAHNDTGLTAGRYIRANSATTFGWSAIQLADLPSTVVNTTTNQTIGGIKTFSSFPVSPSSLPATQYQFANKRYVDSLAVGLSWIAPVKDKDLSTPPVGPASGDRYIVKTSGTGAWSGHDEDIAQWNGAAWTFTDATAGMATITVDDSQGWTWTGSEWTLFSPGLTEYTASLGVKLDGIDIEADLSATGGLALSTNSIIVNVDDSSIEVATNTVQVKALGITNAMLAGSIEDSKLSTIGTADKVDWIAVNKTGSALNDLADVNTTGATDGQSLVFDVDDSTWKPVTIVGGGGGGDEVDPLFTAWNYDFNDLINVPDFSGTFDGDLDDIADGVVYGKTTLAQIESYDDLVAGLVIGSTVQAYDATLTSIALLGTGADKYLYTTDVDVWTEGDITAFGRSILDDADEATFKATVNLEIGTDVLAQQTIGIADNNLVEIDHAAVADNDYAKFTANGLEGRSYAEVKQDLDLEIGVDVQAYDAQLADIAGLAVTDGNIIVGDGSNWIAESGATARTSLGLGLLDSPTFAGLTSSSSVWINGTANQGIDYNGTNGVRVKFDAVNFLDVRSGNAYLYLTSNFCYQFATTALLSYSDKSRDLGTTAKYWRDTFTEDLYLNATARLNGANAGRIGITGTLDAFSMTAANALTVNLLAGAIDAGDATSLEIPNGTAPTVDAEGEIAYETDRDILLVFDGTNSVGIAATTKFFSFVIKAPAAADDFSIIQFPRQVTITAVRGLCLGGTNVIGSLVEYGTDGTTAGAAVDSTDFTITTAEFNATSGFENATIAAGGWLRWTTTSVSGTVDFLNVTVEYQER